MNSRCLHDQTLDCHRVLSALFARTSLAGSVETARAVGAGRTSTSEPLRKGRSADRRKQSRSRQWRSLCCRANSTRSADLEEEKEVEPGVANVVTQVHLGPVSSSSASKNTGPVPATEPTKASPTVLSEPFVDLQDQVHAILDSIRPERAIMEVRCFLSTCFPIYGVQRFSKDRNLILQGQQHSSM